jgi:hypothetical protein
MSKKGFHFVTYQSPVAQVLQATASNKKAIDLAFNEQETFLSCQKLK